MLSKLRTKSEKTRIIVAFAVAFFATAIIVVFWIWSMSGRFSDSREQVKDEAKPFNVLVDSFGSIFSDYQQGRAEQKAQRAQIQAAIETQQEENIAQEESLENSDTVGEEEATGEMSGEQSVETEEISSTEIE